MKCPECKNETSKTRHNGLEYCLYCKEYREYTNEELKRGNKQNKSKEGEMRQPKTREVSWMMMMRMQDDTVTLCLEVEGKQKRYSLNGNEFRRQLDCLKKSGFNLKEKVANTIKGGERD